jgi:SAM-dependent methyltransferase
VNPFYLARRALGLRLAAVAAHIQGRTLDVGCGSKPYRNLFPVTSYVGLEVGRGDGTNSRQADVVYDGESLPFADGVFDALVSFQVLEHVFKPEGLLREMHRVLRPSGGLLLSVPFVWDEHEQPWDCARYSSFGLKALLEASGFEILQHEKTLADASVLLQLANAYLYKVMLTRSPFVNLLLTMALMAPVNVVGLAAARLLPKNQDLFLDNVVLAQRGALEQA